MKKILSLMLALPATAALAQNTALDSAFGTYGKVLFPVTANGFNSLQLTNDGKIVAGGYSTSGSYTSFMLGRCDTAGNIDNTFGTNGVQTLSFAPNTNARITAVDIQSDNKIIAAGHTNANGNYSFVVARLNTDGSLDNTFGSGGVVFTAIGDYSRIYDMKLQPDGKIVVGGVSRTGTNNDFALARYNTDGSLDNTFGNAGIVTAGILTNSHDSVAAIMLQPDGKIVATGKSTDIGPTSIYAHYQTVMRFGTDGLPDSTFGNGGIATQQSLNGDFYTTAMTLQADNKIVTVARIGYMHAGAFIARYNANGTKDLTFGAVVESGSGRRGLETYFGINNSNSGQTFANTVVMRPNGSILLAGNYSMNASLKQLKPNGTVDSSFGNNGLVFNQAPPYNDIRQLRLMPNGRIVAAIQIMGGTGTPSIIRYRATGNGGSPLPVTLLDFKAYASGASAQLEWVTTQEKNSDYFAIERSVDGRQYEAIGKVAAAGNSDKERRYSFADAGLVAGNYYYRLKLADKDASFTYSKVAEVNISSGAGAVTLYPNPAGRQGVTLSIKVAEATTGTIAVVNAEGGVIKVVNTSLLKNENHIKISTADLSSGVYFIQVKDGNGRFLAAPQRMVVK